MLLPYADFIASWTTYTAIFLMTLVAVRVFFQLERKTEAQESILHKGRMIKLFFREIFSRFAYANSFLPFPKYRSKIERLIRDANQEDNWTFEEFVAAQELWALGLGLGMFLTLDSVPIAIGGLVLGFYAPYIRLDAARKVRQRAILKDLPYMMDLMTLSVQAGADFIFATQNIIENFPDRPLRNELQLLLAGIRAGSSRKEALKKMKERCNLIEVTSLCGALIRADEMGTGLVDALKVQSVYIKRKRMQELREKAKQAATLMIIPLIMLIFPSMFILILGPIAIKLYQTLFGEGG